MNEPLQKQIRNCVEKHSAQLKSLAVASYAQQGRGHVMFFCKVPTGYRAHFKPYSASYISQSQEAKNVELRPQSADPELEKMVRDYDPESETVLLAFWGTQYARVTMRLSDVLTDEEWSRVIIAEGNH